MKYGDPFAGVLRVRVSALIYKNQSILLVKQQVPTRNNPIWLPPGGAIELGEFSKQSVKREVREETNLSVSGLRLRYLHEFVEPPYHAIELYYHVSEFEGELGIGSDPELQPDKQQIKEVQFVSFRNMNSMDIYPEFLKQEINLNNLNEPGIKHF